MSSNIPTRRPSAAGETFITTTVIVFFLSIAAFLFSLEDKKETAKVIANPEEHASLHQPVEKQQGKTVTENQIESGNVLQQSHRMLRKSHCENDAEDLCRSEVIAPMPSLQIQPEKFIVDAANGQTLISRRNSLISIPPDAFLDKDGNVVKGNVDVSYREFHNYLDFFLSGIPMNDDSAGIPRQFESAGMMELTASKDNKPVYVNRDRKISVLLATVSMATDYNLYYFDKKQQRWIYKGKDMVVQQMKNAAGRQFTGSKIDSAEKKFRFYDSDHVIRLYAMMEPKEKRKFFMFKKTVPKFTFHLMSASKSIPELQSIRTITWKYAGQDAIAMYNDIFGLDRKEKTSGKWKNVNIQPVQEDDTYQVTLHADNDTLSMKVFPRLLTESSIKKFNQRFAAYYAAQEQRLASERERFEKFTRDTARYFANNPRYERAGLTAEYYAMRQFQLDGFGIWNCDRPVEIKNATTVQASFADQDNKTVTPLLVYLADKKVNTVYSYNSRTLNNFQFNPEADNLLWAVFPGEIVVSIKPAEFREKYAQSKNVCRFRIMLDKNAIVSKADLKGMLDFGS